MDSFKTKIRPKRQRKREKKNNCFVLSNPTRNRKFQKNSKKIQKMKTYHYGYIASQNRLKEDEKERKEKLSPRFVPSRRGRENSKKIAKKFKKLKIPLRHHSKPKYVGKG